ncbi:MAG: hypothetical protein Tsb0026_04760 [Sulfuricaulis sp.]
MHEMQRIFAPGKSRRGLYRTVAPGAAPVNQMHKTRLEPKKGDTPLPYFL